MSAILRLIWRTQEDSEVCPICKELNGYTWTIKAGDPLPKQLIHPEFGVVYDTRPAIERSLIKEENGRICRCTLLHQIDVSDLFTAHFETAGRKESDEKISITE